MLVQRALWAFQGNHRRGGGASKFEAKSTAPAEPGGGRGRGNRSTPVKARECLARRCVHDNQNLRQSPSIFPILFPSRGGWHWHWQLGAMTCPRLKSGDDRKGNRAILRLRCLPASLPPQISMPPPPPFFLLLPRRMNRQKQTRRRARAARSQTVEVAIPEGNLRGTSQPHDVLRKGG